MCTPNSTVNDSISILSASLSSINTYVYIYVDINDDKYIYIFIPNSTVNDLISILSSSLLPYMYMFKHVHEHVYTYISYMNIFFYMHT
jgi:hypothetical protein